MMLHLWSIPSIFCFILAICRSKSVAFPLLQKHLQSSNVIFFPRNGKILDSCSFIFFFASQDGWRDSTACDMTPPLVDMPPFIAPLPTPPMSFPPLPRFDMEYTSGRWDGRSFSFDESEKYNYKQYLM